MDISRRSFVASSGAVAAFPSQIFAAPKRPEYVAWHERDAQGHQTLLNQFGEQGYRTTSLSLYGDVRSPLHAAVMVKRQTVHSERQQTGLNLIDLRAREKEMAGNGMYPYIITGVGSGDNIRFGVSFRPMNTPPKMKFLKGSPLISENTRAFRERRRLIWINSYGSPSDFKYCAIWSGEESIDAWNYNSKRTKGSDLREIYLAMKKGWGHPELITVTPDGRYLTYYTDDQLGDVSLRGEMSTAAYQREVEEHDKKGYFPYKVSATASGSKTKFAAIFAQRERGDARTFRSTGSTSNSAIDQVIADFMKDHALRGSSLAIAHQKRLVYAKGYTYAEPNYPDVRPETLFRVASIAKHITALALFRFMELASSDGGSFGLDTKVQSLLKLRQPNGDEPLDPRFDNITVGHLLDATAGLEGSGYHLKSVEAAAAFNKPLPATAMQIARHLTKFKLKHDPGDLGGARYGKVSYFLLSLVLTKLANAHNFEGALNELVMQAGGLKRLRNARSLVEDQLPNEARYHLNNLQLGESVRSDERPLVPTQYGELDYEAVGGPGGLSIAMPDLARLGAVLSDPDGGVFLSKENRANYLRRAISQQKAIKAAGGKRGVSGFEGLAELSSNPAHFKYSKGGSLGGTRASIIVRTNGHTVAFAYNGGPREGITTEWWKPLKSLLNSGGISWPQDDQFPLYGISSL